MSNLRVEKYKIPSSLGGDKYICMTIKTTNDYKNPVFTLSGRTIPMEYVNDFKIDGEYSYIDMMALNGLTIIYIDFIGFNHSSDYDPDQDEPKINYNDVYRDVMDSIKWLKENKNIGKFTIYGYSATTVPALMVADRHPDIIEKIMANSMAKHTPTAITTFKGEKKYMVDFERWKNRRVKDIPPERLEEILPQKWLDDNINFILESKFLEKEQHTGMDYSRHMIITGQKKLEDYFAWENISQPILFTSGEWDRDCDIHMLKGYLDKCSSKVKKVIIIEDGTHWICVETKRYRLVNLLCNFVLYNSTEYEKRL